MLDNIFWFFMGIIGNIVKFIIVSGIIGFILLLPFLLKGGWLLGIIIYGFLFICIGTFLVDKHNQNKDHFEEMMKRREEKGKEDEMLERVLDTEDLTNNRFIIYEKKEDKNMSLKEATEVLENFSEEMEDIYCKTKINNTRERDAIKSILNIINKSLIIPKKDLKEIKDRKEKENLINEEYNKETRSYLMNVGQICLCEVLEYKYGGNIENE